MLDFDTALGILNKYGYTSISVPPYIYQNDKSIGVCYTYVDEDYGELERIRIFEKAEEFEDFIKKYNWYCANGKNYHVRMILDNYESINPKVIFLRNEKIMVEGEMFDIDSYDARESQRELLDDVSKVIYESGDLLLVYDEMKSRQLQYLKNIIALKNELRTRYYDLQKEVDTYNKYKVERELKLLPEIADLGINENLEIAIKDKYNKYVSLKPSYEEAVVFLKEVWEFILSLELNTKFYEAQKEENDVRNERKVVEQKIALMKKLNDNLKPFFGIDLVSKFKKINKTCKEESSTISNESIQESIDAVRRKYSFFEKLDILKTSDYLREAIQNTNYEDLALKYAKDSNLDIETFARKPLNEVAANLTVQYKEKLDISEQAILVLYNNKKYRVLFDFILNIENFDTMPIKQLLKKLNGIKDFSKLKSECYDSVKRRIDDPLNVSIKQSLFANYDFTTFDTFVESLVNELKKLRSINNKMIIDGNINMYLLVNNVNDIKNKKFVMVTNDLSSLYVKAKELNEMIGITLLKEKTPVLYSPYYFDLGDIYNKEASPQMTINEMINFELLIDTTDIIVNIDPNKTKVVKYQSTPIIVENLSIVDDIKKYSKTTFCKFAFNSNLVNVPVDVKPQVEVVEASEENVNIDNQQNVEPAIPMVNTDESSSNIPVSEIETKEEPVVDAKVSEEVNENVSDVINSEEVKNDENNNELNNVDEKTEIVEEVENTLENESHITEDMKPIISEDTEKNKEEIEIPKEETIQDKVEVAEVSQNDKENKVEEETKVEKIEELPKKEEVKDEEIDSTVVKENNTLPMMKKVVNKNVMHTGVKANSLHKDTVEKNVNNNSLKKDKLVEEVDISKNEAVTNNMVSDVKSTVDVPVKKTVSNIARPQTVVKKVSTIGSSNKSHVPKMVVSKPTTSSKEVKSENK